MLPPFEVNSPWWMESGPVVDEAKNQFGLDVTVVRLLDGERFPGGPVSYLAEAPGVDADDLAPFAEPLGDDPRRASYAEIGGVAALIDWADSQLASAGAERTGPAIQVRTWNLSCLLRIPSTVGELWLKAVPDFFSHEAAVVQAVAEVDPTLVPEVVAARPGTMLMRSAGTSDGYGVGPDEHFAAVRRLHRAVRALDLDGLVSVPRLDVDGFAAALDDLVARHVRELDDDERAKLMTLADECRDRWRAAGTELSLVHGDLHGGNLRLGADDCDAVILDWGDAVITHPLFDLSVLHSYSPDWPPVATDRWLELLGVGRPEWDAFSPLASIRLAIVYRSFCDHIEASEQIYHASDIVPAIRRGLEALT